MRTLPLLSSLLLGIVPAHSQETPSSGLKVLYVADGTSSERAAAFERFLEERFGAVTVADHERYDRALSRAADVVLFDWDTVSQDRPIALTPSVRTGAKVVPVRSWLQESFFPQLDPERVPSFFGAAECEHLDEEGPEAFAARFTRRRGSYHPDERSKLVVDPDLEAWRVANADRGVIARSIEGLASGGEPARRGRRLLERYVACGPGPTASAEEWLAWFVENHDYLFFTDLGGYRWYVDPLAKARKVPTEELRGAARADRSS